MIGSQSETNLENAGASGRVGHEGQVALQRFARLGRERRDAHAEVRARLDGHLRSLRALALRSARHSAAAAEPPLEPALRF